MADHKIAHRYAKAIFEVAKTALKLEEIKNDMLAFKSVCLENKQLMQALKSPIISAKQKNNLLSDVFNEFQSETLNFFNLVSTKNRSGILNTIAAEFLDLYNQEKGILEAEVISAHALSDDETKKVRNYLEKQTGAKEVKIAAAVQPSLLGGLVIKYGDLLIDNSIQSQIKNLKKELQII